MTALFLAGCASNADRSTEPRDGNIEAPKMEAAAPAGDLSDIIIGVAGPMTGNLQTYGAQLRRGAEMAVRDINAAGGVMGRELKLEVADDQCGISEADTAAADLVEKRVVFVVGHFCSGSSIRASKIYAPANVLQIAPSSTNPLLTDDAARSDITTLLRVVGRDDTQGAFAADWLMSAYAGKPIAVVSDNSLYGKGIAGKLMARLQEKGVAPVMSGAFAQGQTSYTNLMAKLKKVRPAVLYVAAYQDDIGRLTWTLRTARLDMEIVGPDILNTPEFWSFAQAQGNGVRFSDVLPPMERAAAAEIVAKSRGEGEDPVGYTLNAYAAVQVFAAAATGTRGTDAKTMAVYLRANNVPTILGDLRWDAKGDLSDTNYIWYIWQNGQSYRE
jgi:branched-chain amino acid transport system substrate-binding protein